MVRAFLADESGATALEHALVTAFIALAVLGAVALAGAKIYAVIGRIAVELGGGFVGSC